MRKKPTSKKAEKAADEMAEIIAEAWDRERLTPLEQERRLRRLEVAVMKALEKRRGH